MDIKKFKYFKSFIIEYKLIHSVSGKDSKMNIDISNLFPKTFS